MSQRDVSRFDVDHYHWLELCSEVVHWKDKKLYDWRCFYGWCHRCMYDNASRRISKDSLCYRRLDLEHQRETLYVRVTGTHRSARFAQ